MPYKPTGRPAGRPPKNGPKPAPEPEVEAGVPPEPENAPESSPQAVQAPSAAYGPLTVQYGAAICGACFPDGWAEGATGTACQHGVWTRRL